MKVPAKERSVPLVALVGATASGKTGIAISLARRFPDVELVSMDSMTIYRGMSVGTAKPSESDLRGICYHLIDMVQPWQEYSVSQFQHDAKRVLEDIGRRGCSALLVGGTGLYYQALVDDLRIPPRWPSLRSELECSASSAEGLSLLYKKLAELDPVAAARMRPNNERRIVRALEVTLGSGKPFSQHGPGLFSTRSRGAVVIGVDLPRQLLFERIEARLDDSLQAGWIQEVEDLLSNPEGLSRTARQALGYKELIDVVEDGLSIDEARDKILARTKRFAKRQLSWFRRDPRIKWFDSPEAAEKELVMILDRLKVSMVDGMDL